MPDPRPDALAQAAFREVTRLASEMRRLKDELREARRENRRLRARLESA